MHRSAIASVFMCACVSVGSSSHADIIDFDSLPDAQNIYGVNLGGVTITNPTGVVEVYSNNRFGVGYHSGTNAIASFWGNALSSNPMVFLFDAPQRRVSLYGGDGGGDDDSFLLYAYDASNVLVDARTSGLILSGNPYQRVEVRGQGIVRVEAVWSGPSSFGIGYDTLEFIPAPGAAALLAVATLGAIRRRR